MATPHTTTESKSGRVRVLITVLALATLLSGFYFAGRAGTDPNVYSNDFSVFLFGARELIEGRDPYKRSLSDQTPYLYPPLLAELMVPLAVLPVPLAAYVWFLISAVALMLAVLISASPSWSSGPLEWARKPEGRHMLVAACAVVVLGRFAVDNFQHGQVNTVVLALSVAHLALFARGREVAAAGLLAIAISIKLTPALLLVYHVGRRRLRFTASCVVLLAAMTVVSFAPFGMRAPAAFDEFLSRTVKNRQGFDLAYSGNQSLRGVIARARGETGPAATDPLDPFTVTFGIIMLAWAMVAAYRRDQEADAVSPFFCCVALLSPLSWKAHFVIALLPVARLASQAIHASCPLRAKGAAVALIAAFSLFNLTSPKIIGLAAAEWADAHSLVFFGCAVILIGVLIPTRPTKGPG